ncbi:hypothetical protein NL676_018024 [Syzygium grande]|nr:hypothetical protein NL676_018024 [Syzygium grande]
MSSLGLEEDDLGLHGALSGKLEELLPEVLPQVQSIWDGHRHGFCREIRCLGVKYCNQQCHCDGSVSTAIG